jgi:hypothetical protein
VDKVPSFDVGDAAWRSSSPLGCNMPNGFQGSEAQWHRMEAPLIQVDPVLERFAASHKLSLSKNYHGHPERALRWNTAVECLIQLYLEDADRLTFNLWLCASQDRGAERFWRREFLVKDQKLEDFAERNARSLANHLFCRHGYCGVWLQLLGYACTSSAARCAKCPTPVATGSDLGGTGGWRFAGD